MKLQSIVSVGVRSDRNPKNGNQEPLKKGELPRAWVCRATFAWLLAGAALVGDSLRAQMMPDSGLLNQQQRREERLQEFLRDHSDSTGVPRPDLWRKGIADTMGMSVATSIEQTPAGLTPNLAAPAPCGQWTQIGPAPLRIDKSQFQGLGPDSGQVTDIAIDPRNSSDQVIYIASNDGGIWRSTDGGATWQPKTDLMQSLSMGAVALDPGNPSVVYAGTGNQFDGALLFSKGVGLYRSADMGDTWTLPAGNSVLTGQNINRIVLPAAGTLLVGTGSGLYKSVDGGDHYGNDAPNFSNGQPILLGEIDDIDLDTATAGTVYACVNGVGLLRSTDSGSTFGGSLFDANVPATFFYLSFAQSQNPDNQTMYVNIETKKVPFNAKAAKIFKSTNGGTIWSELPNGSAMSVTPTAVQNCQCDYDQTIGVDPKDANRVFIGFQQLFESTDGGAHFSLISGTVNLAPPNPTSTGDKIHWDHHAMVFSPHLPATAPTRVYLGTDGGISYTENDGTSFANINEGIATCLFRDIDIGRGSAANRAYTYGGCQDTGVIEHRPTFPGNDWHLGVDGDGGGVVLDPVDPTRAYGADDGSYVYTTDGGATWFTPFTSPPYLGTVTTPPPSVWRFAIDPNNGNNIFAISAAAGSAGFTPGASLYRSTDRGVNFASIHTFPASVQTIANVKLNSNLIWVGLTDGTVQYSTDALAATPTWTAVTIPGAPGQVVAGIAIDPVVSDQVVVVYPGFCGIFCSPGNRTRHVFRTTDRGATWTDISGTDGGNPAQNLPDIPLHDVVIDPATTPHTIIVASDGAVMRTPDLGATWQVLGIGLPTVYCSRLALDATATPPLLRVGTYGRSVFELTPAACCNLTCPADITQKNDPGLCGAIVNYPGPTMSGACGPVSTTPPSGSFFPVGATTVTNSDTTGANCTFTVTVKDVEPPKVTCSVASPSLWPPDHNLVNVGLSATATDNCDGTLPVSVAVFSNEDDEMPTGDGNFSPDAKNLAPGTLRLRQERRGDGPGRVYLVVNSARDKAGNLGFTACTVVVPHDRSKSAINAVNAQAALALAYCLANNGAPPLGYFVIGDGPIIGPKQ